MANVLIWNMKKYNHLHLKPPKWGQFRLAEKPCSYINGLIFFQMFFQVFYHLYFLQANNY